MGYRVIALSTGEDTVGWSIELLLDAMDIANDFFIRLDRTEHYQVLRDGKMAYDAFTGKMEPDA